MSDSSRTSLIGRQSANIPRDLTVGLVVYLVALPAFFPSTMIKALFEIVTGEIDFPDGLDSPLCKAYSQSDLLESGCP